MSVETYRCHVNIPRMIWKELRTEAAARQVTVSRVIVERLERAAGGGAGWPMHSSVDDGERGNKKWRVTIRLDRELFEQLSHEAAGLGMTRPAVVRQWLRRAAMTTGKKGEGGVLNTITAPDELEIVAAPEGKRVMFDF